MLPLDKGTTCELLEQQGRLTFLTTHKAGGVTVPVAILLAPRRRAEDRCWAGTVWLHRGYRYIGLTRATERLYVFAEDLRPWLSRPAYGKPDEVEAIIVAAQPTPCGTNKQPQPQWADRVRAASGVGKPVDVAA